MPSFPVPGPVRRALPIPLVSKVIVRQPIDLRPAGNTVAVTTLADNPFEGSQRITVRTQASGGMARPDNRQVSRTLMFMGDDTVPAKPKDPPGVLDIFNTLITGATNVFTTKYNSEVEEAKAKGEEAKSAAKQSGDRTTALLAQLAQPVQAIAKQLEQPVQAIAKHKAISLPLLVVGGGALLVAGYLFLKKPKSKTA